MFAIIRTGGKQYRVAENDRITVERLPDAPGSTVALKDVLMIGGGNADTPTIDAGALADASVAAEVIEHRRGDKVLVFKKKRRKNHRRLRGHRQALTVLRIDSISAAAEKDAAKAKPATTEAPVPPAEEPARALAEGAAMADAEV